MACLDLNCFQNLPRDKREVETYKQLCDGITVILDALAEIKAVVDEINSKIP